MIGQGEVHWIDFGQRKGAEPAYRRPCVVIQNDAFNRSRIATVVVAAVTTNLGLGEAFGNVTLRKGEAGLRRKSVVNISQLATIDRECLDGRIGRLTERRLNQVLQGVFALLRPIDS